MVLDLEKLGRRIALPHPSNGDIKKNMLKYAKDHGVMKTLQKRGYVVTEVVAA